MATDKKIDGTIEKIVEKIKTGYQPEKIILFGSYAWGKPGRDSDIDLLIVKDTTKRPIDRRVEVRTFVADRDQNIPIELIVLTPSEIEDRLDHGDQFIRQIMDKGRLLYAV